MTARYVGALDQGTTSTRFLIFDQSMKPVAGHQVEHTQHTPHAGWLEHDAGEIFRNALLCVNAATAKLPAGARVEALGITNQRETTVAWSARSGEPLCKAIVWSDVRTAGVVAKVSNGDAGFARAVCGLPCSTYFSAVKMMWLLENVPAVAAAKASGDLRFGTMDAWLIWKLTAGAVYATDCTNASRTMLMDLRTLQWDAALCARFGVPLAALPKIVSCSEAIGTVVPALVGGAALPIHGCIGDQQGALVGQLCLDRGAAKNTYGTGCFLLANVGTDVPPPSKSGLLTTVGFKFGDAPCTFALEGAVAGAGATVQWLRDKLGIISTAREVETLARTVPDAGGVVFVPAFGGLLAPHWRADARGTIVGMTQQTSKAHLARATLDAVAQQVTVLVRTMEADAGIACGTLNVDGGMSANKLLMQLQADSLGSAVAVAAMPETTALGAAIAASLVGGVWGDLAQVRAAAQAARRSGTVQPRSTPAQRAALQTRWDEGVKRALNTAKL
jgi:glycerol kinase